MAVNVTYPGVYIDEGSSGVRPIESAGTSTAVFIGETTKGSVGEPKLIFKWQEYVDEFGDIKEIKSISDSDDMGFAVYTYFLNGGGIAYIVRVDSTLDASKVFESLEKIRDINIICLPGKPWTSGNAWITEAYKHALKMKNRMVIVDLEASAKLASEKDVDDLNLTGNEYAVAYYPWLKVSNPSYKLKEDGNPVDVNVPATLAIAPSSFVAGMWAKTDGRRGVWKAPAGIETGLLGVAELADNVHDAQQGILNPLNINCIRRMPGAGPVIWGARTLAANSEWRYVPIRRTANMIEESIYNNIQWAVFEPNDSRLWSSLRINIDAFMNSLWRAGAFQGDKASDAYYVRCNLGDTMTQNDIDRGKVIVEVGFAPLKPAEFVIIRIQQKVAQQ